MNSIPPSSSIYRHLNLVPGFIILLPSHAAGLGVFLQENIESVIFSQLVHFSAQAAISCAFGRMLVQEPDQHFSRP